MKHRLYFLTKFSRKEDGFVIPIVLAMGFIMILLATTAVVKSQNDNVTAINKKSGAKSLLAAETGVSRIQELLNRNRALAPIQFCAAAPTTYGDCPDTGTTISWDPDIRSNIPKCPSDYSADDTKLVKGNNWQKVSTDTPIDDSKGEYRIVSYTASSGQGTLTVEGRLNGGQSGEAKSKLQATIPISYATGDLVASLWTSGSIGGTPQINSSVVINSCSASASTVASAGAGTKLINTNRSFPAVPTAPTTVAAASNGAHALASISASVPTKELPRAGDAAMAASGPDASLYKYVVSSLDGSFKITPGKKVWLWVTGNVDLSDKVIVNQCQAEVTPATTPPTLVNSNCGPFDVRIYSTDTAKTLKLNKGTAVCDVFFLMPQYDVNFDNATGTASSQNCGVSAKTLAAHGSQNTGIYWVKSWNGGISGITLIDPPRARWSTAITETGLTNETSPLKPTIGPATAWDKQSF